VLGYMSVRDLSPAATYKGEIGTASVSEPYPGRVGSGEDFSNWNEYHIGRLNDKRRSATVYDDNYDEKVIVKCDDNTEDALRIYYKLEEGSVVNGVDVYAGALAVLNSWPPSLADVVPVATIGENPISAINVYLSETENPEDWKKLGTVTEGINSGSLFLRRYEVRGEELYGNYVIIEIKGTPGQMLFGINEVQIWSNALLSTDE